MKKILVLLTLVIGLIACKNQKIDFPDFGSTAGYFPYQYPVRTLVLGDYIYDNTNDNNHIFLISATFGGVYENQLNREFTIELAPNLCDNVLFQSTLDTIRLMPASYYTLSSDKIIIPPGKVNAGIEVHLNDAFFDDPLSIKLGYVIPMRIVSATNLDSVLRGQAITVNPDPRIPGDWATQPKDFTMFAVKFINPYHGKYLHRGTSVVKDASSAVLETTAYHSPFVENNEIWSLVTTSKNQVNVQGNSHSTLIPGQLKMKMTFTGTGSCTIAEDSGSAYTITGNGQFVTNGDEWGGQKRDAIYINYQLQSGNNTLFATDTLVVRDRAVVMEVYNPEVITK